MGPAWSAADGAMEGTIGIQAQMISVDRILAGGDIESLQKDIEDAGLHSGLHSAHPFQQAQNTHESTQLVPSSQSIEGNRREKSFTFTNYPNA